MTDAIGAPTAVNNDDAYYYENALTPEALMIYLSTRLGGVDEEIQKIFDKQQDADKLRSAFNKVIVEIKSLEQSAEKNAELTAPGESFEKISLIIDSEIGTLNPQLAEDMKAKFAEEGFIFHGEPQPVTPPPEVVNTTVNHRGQTETYSAHAYSPETGSNGRPVSDRPDSGHTVVNPDEAVATANENAEPPPDVTYTTAEVENTSEYLKNMVSDLESTSQMNMIQLQSLMSSRQTAISLSTNLISKLSESTQKVVDNIR